MGEARNAFVGLVEKRDVMITHGGPTQAVSRPPASLPGALSRQQVRSGGTRVDKVAME
jgi:hypothetical protein